MCLGALSSVPSQRRSTSRLAIVDALHLTTMRKHRQAQLGADLAKQSNAVGTLLLQRGPSTSLLWISIRHTPPCHPHSGCSSGLRTPFAFKRVSFFRAATGKLRIPARHVPATCSRAPCMPCGWRRKRGDHPCWRSNGTRRSDGRPHGLSCWRLRLRRVCAGDVVAGCARMRASKLRRGGGRGGGGLLFLKRGCGGAGFGGADTHWLTVEDQPALFACFRGIQRQSLPCGGVLSCMRSFGQRHSDAKIHRPPEL